MAKLKFSCEHTQEVEVDESTKTWLAFYRKVPCFICQPTQTIARMCGCTEETARGFFSPRAMETAAMKDCAVCAEAK